MIKALIISILFSANSMHAQTSFLKKSDTATMLYPYLRVNVATANYQAKLINQTNIKSINSQSLLGAGNITIAGGAVDWVDILNKPSTFTPSSHSHVISDVTGLSASILSKVNISDTSSMLAPYLRKIDTTAMISPYLRSNIAAATYGTISGLALKINISDSAAMLNPYLRKIDTTAMVLPYLRSNVAAATYQIKGSYLTANQTVTLSGDISGSGATAITTVIGSGKVTNAMLAGSIDLTTKVTGVLPFANGGVGASAATSATTGTMTVSMTTETITITPTGACTFNASGGVAGQRTTFVITTSGTTSLTLTWGTNFKTTGTLATGTVTAKIFTVSFLCTNGTQWVETGRTAAQ